MQSMSVSRFKATCLEQFEQIARTGKPLVITKRGKAIAAVVPHGAVPAGKNFLGCMRGSVLKYGDVVAPAVPESEWNIRA